MKNTYMYLREAEFLYCNRFIVICIIKYIKNIYLLREGCKFVLIHLFHCEFVIVNFN